LDLTFCCNFAPQLAKAADLNHPAAGRNGRFSGFMASAPPTITADFVLGKTGNRNAVALAREAVAAARL